MRLLLDAHVSGRRIAVALRKRGHDVRAADEERGLDGWDDERLLALAATEARILVTFNIRDFARIARQWAELGRHHAGCAIFVRVDHGEFGVILDRLSDELAARPDPQAWSDYTAFIGRNRAEH